MNTAISVLGLPLHHGEGLRVGWSNALHRLRQYEGIAA